MVGKVATIAGNAFRETVRQPVYCIVLGIAAVVIPAATIATTDETGNRRSRTHGWPRMRSGLAVIRSKDMAQGY